MHKVLTILVIYGLGFSNGLYAQRFVDRSEAAGVKTVAVDTNLMAGGVVWLDYDKDYYPDLLFTNGTASPVLYRNNWDGTFTKMNLLNVPPATMGAVAADFDGDGFPDLYLTTLDGTPNQLLRNDGSGGFTNVTHESGANGIAYSAGATVGDYDNDGDLDLYVANYLRTNDPLEGGQPNFFYRNEGNLRFTELAAELGLDDEGCGLGATFLDYDNNGTADIYLANDYGYSIAPNELFRNGGGTFGKTAAANGTAATINAMGIAKGDYDNDGDTDLYVTNIQINPLFTNEQSGEFFQFRSESAGVALPEYTSWGTSFADFDLDGWEDLIVGNGEITELENQPEPMTYFRNRGDGTFANASESTGVGEQVLMARGLAVADYDLDGLPDVAVQAVQTRSTNDQYARLLHNEATTDGNWLEVATPAGLSHLFLHAGEGTLRREIDGGSSYLSQAAVPLHFGWPADLTADSLVAVFTDGQRRTFTDFPVNALVEIQRDGSWLRIRHQTDLTCADEAAAPVVEKMASGQELLVQRKEIRAYGRLADLTVNLRAGEPYEGVARTQDATFVDTIAQATGCPSLRFVTLRVTPEAETRSIYPNPAQGVLTLELAAAGGPLSVTVFSTTGTVRLTREYELGRGESIQQIILPKLASGTYVCRLVHGGKTTHHKFVSQ